MEINWDSIKFIFQIPREWYSYIHRKIHNAYGTLFIRVMDGEYGGMKIDIDRAIFKEAVEDAVDLDGYVKSVNNIEPDENGNVDLDENFLEASDITTQGIVVGTDYVGDQTVCSPNHKHKVKDVEGAVKSVNGNGPDADGNVEVEVEGGVKTVNDIEPDEDGNVDLGQLVYTVNSHEPDEDGNIEFDIVESVDGVAPVAGNVPLGAIRSIDNNIRPVNGNVNLFDYYSPEGHTHTHTEISDWDNATKDFLEASDITTPGIVVGTDYTGEYTVCSPNHKHNAKDIVNSETDGFVTINTEQTITGEKTFRDNIDVEDEDGGSISINASLGEININGDGSSDIVLLGNGITRLECGENGFRQTFTEGGQQTVSSSISQNNQEIRLKIAGVSRPIVLDAGENKAQLATQPTDNSEDSLAIATVGYVKKNAITVDDGDTLQTKTFNCVTNVSWNGTQIVIEKNQLQFKNGVLIGFGNTTRSTIETVAYSPS